MSESSRVLVSPTFPLEWRDVEDFLGEFGPYNGRYVPRFPDKWVSKLKDHIQEIDAKHITPIQKHALFERLRRDFSLCTYGVDWRWQDSLTWAANVLNQTHLLGESSIVVGDAIDPTPFSCWGDVVGEIKQSRARTLSFGGRLSDYINLCKPLLLNSTGAYLVDPYLDPLSVESENLILSFFDLMKGSSCYRLDLMGRQSAYGGRDAKDSRSWMSIEDIYTNLTRVYKDKVPKDRSFNLHIIQEPSFNQEGLRLHDRFFLTLNGAINFGQGFFVSGKKQTQHNAFVVDRDHHSGLKETFINGVSRFSEKLPKKKGVLYPVDVKSFCLVR